MERIANIRRIEIIQAFFKTLSEKGLAKATIREIADTAGCKPGLLHHYFEDKRAIIEASVEYAVNLYKAELQEGLARFDTTEGQLRFLIPRYLDLGRLNREISRGWLDLYALSKNEDSVRRPVRDCFRDARGLISEVIARGIRKGEFRKVNPEEMATVILAILEGVTLLWVVDPDRTPVEAVGERIQDLIGTYVKKKPG